MTVLPLRPHQHRHAELRSPRLREWLEQDHEVSASLLVPAGVAALAAMLLFGYLLLFGF